MNQQESQPESDRDPKFVQGRRQYSIAALQERIEAEFLAETDPKLLLESSDEAARRDLIREATEYVLATESIVLSRPERLALLDALYSELFRFGPLDRYLADPQIMELSIDGPDSIYVRHGAGEMQAVEGYFEDSQHLAKIVQRVLSTAGVQYSDATPFVEVGISVLGRPARITVAAPPISPVLHVDVRLHPSQPYDLDGLIETGMLSRAQVDAILVHLKANRGLMIAGDVGTGKTTLIQALISALPGHSAVVERSAELHVPPDMDRFTGLDFAAQIEAAIQKQPPWLVLDEIRLDEARAMWLALTGQPRPVCLWAFRAATDPNRLRAAFSMSVRRAQPTVEQEAITSALVDQLPLVVILVRRESVLRLVSLGEWVREGENATLRALTL